MFTTPVEAKQWLLIKESNNLSGNYYLWILTVLNFKVNTIVTIDELCWTFCIINCTPHTGFSTVNKE